MVSIIVLLLLIIGPFILLDQECGLYDQAIIKTNNIKLPLNLKVSIYTRCPQSFQFKETESDYVCYCSSVLYNECGIVPYSDERELIYYLIKGDKIIICEKDVNDSVYYKESVYKSSEIMRHIDFLDIDKSSICIDGSTKIINANLSYFKEIENARDGCFTIICLLVVFFLVVIIEYVVKNVIRPGNHTIAEKRHTSLG